MFLRCHDSGCKNGLIREKSYKMLSATFYRPNLLVIVAFVVVAVAVVVVVIVDFQRPVGVSVFFHNKKTRARNTKLKTRPIQKNLFHFVRFISGSNFFLSLKILFSSWSKNWSQYLVKNSNHPLPDNHTLSARRWRACVQMCVCVCVRERESVWN